MVGNIEADCDIHTIKIIESNKQYFINNYGYIDTHKFSGMQYVVDNYKEKWKWKLKLIPDKNE